MRSRGVLLLDLKDVLVQGPPWPLLAPGRVTVFEEIGQIQHAAWNQCARTHTAHTTARHSARRSRHPSPLPRSPLWRRVPLYSDAAATAHAPRRDTVPSAHVATRAVRRRILAQFSTSVRAEVAALLGGDKKVINSGVILAPPAAMLRHVDALVDEMWALGGRYDRWMVGVDQAAHMLLVYRNRTRQGGAQGKRNRGRGPRFEIATLLPHAIGSVLHVSDVKPSDYTIDEQGVVRTTAADGAAYTMVHQWNRAPYAVQNGIRRAWSGNRVSVL